MYCFSTKRKENLEKKANNTKYYSNPPIIPRRKVSHNLSHPTHSRQRVPVHHLNTHTTLMDVPLCTLCGNPQKLIFDQTMRRAPTNRPSARYQKYFKL